MAFDINHLPHIVDQIRLYKKKAVLNDAQLVAELNAFAHTVWSASFITAMLAGTRQPTNDQATIFTRFLALAFYNYNCTI